MKIVVAVDSFKGTLSSAEAGEIISRAARKRFPDAVIGAIPVADGGEGTVESLVCRENLRVTRVTGPDFEPVDARWGFLGDGTTAVIETASAAGLTLSRRRNPERTTSRGVGELLLEATARGAKHILLGLGGSATNDGGMGLLSALGASFTDSDDRELPPVGASLCRVSRADFTRLAELPKITALCDVTNPLFGPNGAAAIYAPQKGADAAMVERLDAGLRRYARVTAPSLTEIPGAGAAGGLGFAVLLLHGELRRGIEAVLDSVGFDAALSGADAVVTGEGRFDRQSLMGKVVDGVLRRAAPKGVPVAVLCGISSMPESEWRAAGISAVFPSFDRPQSAEALTHDRCAEALSGAADAYFSAM